MCVPASLLSRNDDLLTGKSFDKILKKFFSSPATSFFALLIAVASINAWQLVLPNFSNDNSFIIAAAKNIYDGKGYSLANASVQDLSFTYYEPLNKWPPGYAWLLVLIKKITGADWIIACYILNAIGATLLVLALRKILMLLQVPAWIINGYIIFAGFVPYPFLSFWFADLIAVAFFMWAIVFLMHAVLEKRKLYLFVVSAGLLLGYCTCLKYLYLSISLIPFIFFLFYAIRKNDMKLSKTIMTGTVVLLVCIIYVLWFQKHHTGAAIYVNPTGSGFFPEHLLHVGPIVPGSLIDFKFCDMQLSQALHIPYSKMLTFWKWINVFLMIGTLILIIRYYKENGFHLNTPISIYMNLGLAISISTFFLLGYLSFTQKPYSDHFTKFWTYVQELRYYGVVLIFVQQGILLLIVYRGDLLSLTKEFFISVIIILAVVEIAHGFYYLPKQIFIKKEAGVNRKTERIDLLALKTANELLKRGDKLIICSDSHELDNIASLSGISVLYDWDKLNTILHTSEPVTLLVILSQSSFPYYKQFFSIYNPELLLNYKRDWNYDGANFYIIKLH
jgi:hypothetical protein